MFVENIGKLTLVIVAVNGCCVPHANSGTGQTMDQQYALEGQIFQSKCEGLPCEFLVNGEKYTTIGGSAFDGDFGFDFIETKIGREVWLVRRLIRNGENYFRIEAVLDRSDSAAPYQMVNCTLPDGDGVGFKLRSDGVTADMAIADTSQRRFQLMSLPESTCFELEM